MALPEADGSVASTETSTAGFSPRSTRCVKSFGITTMNCASPSSISAPASRSLVPVWITLK
jgi:hypothetical protein